MQIPLVCLNLIIHVVHTLNKYKIVSGQSCRQSPYVAWYRIITSRQRAIITLIITGCLINCL